MKALLTAAILLQLVAPVPQAAARAPQRLVPLIEPSPLDLRIARTNTDTEVAIHRSERRAVVDFGATTTRDMPSTGYVVRAEDRGGAYLVTTVELEVVPTGPWRATAPIRTLDPPASTLPRRQASGQRSSGKFDPSRRVPPVELSPPPRADLYASVTDAMPWDAEVRLRRHGFARSDDGPVVIGRAETVIATGLRPGDRLEIELAMWTPDEHLGHRMANVRFALR